MRYLKHYRLLIGSMMITGGLYYLIWTCVYGSTINWRYLRDGSPPWYGLRYGLIISMGMLLILRKFSLRVLGLTLLFVVGCITVTHVCALYAIESVTVLNANERAAMETEELFNGVVIPAMLKRNAWPRTPYLKLYTNAHGDLIFDRRPYQDGDSDVLHSMIDDFATMHRAQASESELADYMCGDLFVSLEQNFGKDFAREVIGEAASKVSNPELKRAFKLALAPDYRPTISTRY